jgi:hypothetical protein
MRRLLTLVPAILLALLMPVAMVAQVDPTATIGGFPAGALLLGLIPIVSPVVASLVVSLLNKRDGLIATWPNWSKQALYFVFGIGSGFIASKTGIDMSAPAAFASSFLSTAGGFLLFHLGKSNGSPTPTQV